jgi:uncharacterized protein
MSKGGFAKMDPARRREIAALGGKAAHAKGKAHRWKAGSPEARAAGRAGGVECHRRRLAKKDCHFDCEGNDTIPSPPPEGVENA